MKKNYFYLICLIFNSIFGQNLVPNGSFEDYTVCPNHQGDFDLFGWYKLPNHIGTPDFLNSCSTNPVFSIPVNSLGTQLTHDGNAYIGMFCYNNSPWQLREYVSVPLISPLIVDQFYEVSFYVSLSDNSTAAVSNLGAALTITPVIGNNTLGPIPISPQIFTTNVIINKDNWTKISGTFQASGGEAYLTLGNFFTNEQISIVNLPGNGAPSSYYYIDSVSVNVTNLASMEFENDELRVYPNPFESEINISLQEKKEIKKIQIYSSTGSLLNEFHGNLRKISLSTISKGIYYLIVTTTNDEQIKWRIVRE